MSQLVIKTKHKIAYSSGNFSLYLMQQMVATYIVFFYVDHLGVRPALIGVGMVIHSIVNALVHPFLGHISDKTQTRFGRRIPYIMFGIVPLSATFTLIWIPLTSEQHLFWYFLGVILLFDLFFVLVALNWTSLFPEMFKTLRDRSFVSTWRQLWGILGMILGIALPPVIFAMIGWTLMGILFGVVGLFFWALSIYGAKEPKNPQKTESLPIITALRYTLVNKAFITFALGNLFIQLVFVLLPGAAPFFTKYVLLIPEGQTSLMLGTIFVVALPFVYVWGKLINVWGPRTSALISVVFLFFALIPFYFIQTFTGAIMTSIGIGVGIAGILVVLDIMLSDVIDEDAKKTGIRREGMYFGINGFIAIGSAGLQAIILSVVLEVSGYVSNLDVQPDSAVFGIRFMTSGIPMIILVIVFICFFLYPIKTKPVASEKKENVVN